MPDLTTVYVYEATAFLAAFGITVFSQLLTGRISVKGLLAEAESGSVPRPARVFLLTALMLTALSQVGPTVSSSERWSDTPLTWIITMAVGNAVYLGDKALINLRMIRRARAQRVAAREQHRR